MLRTSALLIAAITLAVPAHAVADKKADKAKKEKKEKEEKEKAEAEAAAAAEAKAAEEAAAAAAAAQPPDAGGGGGVDASGGVGTGDGAAPGAGAAVSGSWSQKIIDRPLNLLKGMIRAQGDLGILKVAGVAAVPPAPAVAGTTNVALAIGAGYGVSDKLEAGISYAIQLKDFEAKGPLALYGLFNLKHSEKMRISAGASFGYNFLAEKIGISAGLAFQYHLNDKMFAYMPPSHFSLGLDPTAFGINLPVGFGFQANEKIFAFVETNLFDLNIEPSGSAFIFADRTPLRVGAFFSPSNKMDVGASFFMPNVPDVADVFVFLVSARMYLGSVPASGGAAAAEVTNPDMTPPAM